MMLIYVNGLNNIPEDLYEAASIDGAGAWQKFRNITVPMLMPAFTVVFFLTLSGSFKMLEENLVLTEGNFGTRMLSLQTLLSPCLREVSAGSELGESGAAGGDRPDDQLLAG